MQGQLLLSGLDFCDFVVNTAKDVFIDSVFINQMVAKLFTFQQKHYCSEK